MPNILCFALVLFCSAGPAPVKPSLSYQLRIDANDLSSWAVEINLENLPDSFRLAMAAHPEYDDRFYRYVTDVTVTSPSGLASITRADSAIWRVVAPGGRSTVRYRIRLPEQERSPRPAWRPFLSPTGGLTGGAHAFMYVLGFESASSEVHLELPSGWQVVTGLDSTDNPRKFRSSSADMLVESPIFVGLFQDWSFKVKGVDHRVVYWAAPDATPFDTLAFLSAIEKLAVQSVELFGRMPYRRYSFMFQDAAYGGLEHPNSVTLGVESRRLAINPYANLGEIAHEFFHTWNLMQIRPAEYGPVTYLTQVPTAGLWFSEGLTLYYADLLLRRAKLPTSDSTRIAHLEQLIARYLANSGNSHFSAESISKVAYNAGPGSLGDYSASAHLVGELLGSMLDLQIRHATKGARSMDDVMRRMLERHGGRRGFTSRDIEESVEQVCGCEVTPFFDSHVRGGGRPIDFDRYLATIGMRTEVRWERVVSNGEPERDLRLWGWVPEGDSGVRLVVGDPATAWARAGLHTGDRLTSINDTPVRTWPELRAVLTRTRIGDTLSVVLDREGVPETVVVAVQQLERPSVRIRILPRAGAQEIERRSEWMQAR